MGSVSQKRILLVLTWPGVSTSQCKAAKAISAGACTSCACDVRAISPLPSSNRTRPVFYVSRSSLARQILDRQRRPATDVPFACRLCHRATKLFRVCPIRSCTSVAMLQRRSHSAPIPRPCPLRLPITQTQQLARLSSPAFTPHVRSTRFSSLRLNPASHNLRSSSRSHSKEESF